MKKNIKAKNLIFFIVTISVTVSFIVAAVIVSKKKDTKPKDDITLFTMEAKTQDYNYFWRFIEEGYPFSEICERKGVNLQQIKQDEFKNLSSIKNHLDYLLFYDRLCNRITSGLHTGHLYACSYITYSEVFKKIYTKLYVFNKYPEVVDIFYNNLKVFEKFYDINQGKKTDKDINGNKLYTLSTEKTDIAKQRLCLPAASYGNYFGLTTDIIEQDKIAYIRIDSFMINDREQQKRYVQDIENFLRQTQKFKHIIIDISLNSGGFPYNYELIIAYNTKKGYKIKNYGLYNESEFTKPYIDLFFNSYSDVIKKIDKIDIPNIQNAGTVKNSKAYMTEYFIEPAKLTNYNPNPDKKFWLITGRKTYSAGDRFTDICKQTGFARVIGQNTAGAGTNSIGPMFTILPNTGLLISFDVMYGLNSEGYCVDEHGTAPDVYTVNGKTSLETCLEEIKRIEQSGK